MEKILARFSLLLQQKYGGSDKNREKPQYE
jgi:hypothetical protein